METCRPPLAACHDGLHIGVRAGSLHRGDEACRLLVGHDQVTGRDRANQVVEAAAGEGHLRHRPSDQHDLAARRDDVQESVEKRQRLDRPEDMDVVEDDDAGSSARRAAGRGTGGDPRRSIGRCRQGRRLSCIDGSDGVEAGGKVAGEVRRVVVELIEAHPGERTRIGIIPERDRGGLAVSGRRDDGEDGLFAAAGQPTEQLGTLDGPAWANRTLEPPRGKGCERATVPQGNPSSSSPSQLQAPETLRSCGLAR